MNDREIPLKQVQHALAEPDSVSGGESDRHIFVRRYFDEWLGQQMLLRVIVEETTSERVVVTVYKTSQISRYLKG